VSGPVSQPNRFSILSFTTVFPRPEAPQFGIFVHSRLQEMARLAPLRVIAPVPWIDYGNAGERIPRRIPPRRSQDGLEIRHPRWFYLPGIASLTPFFLAACSWLSVSREHFDVLDSHFGHPDGTAAAILALATRRPFTVTLRGNETEKAKHPVVRFLMRWSLRRAARVITVSERLRQFAIGLGVDPARVVTIPNGINPAVFYPRPRDECRARIGMAAGACHILSAGALIPRKGHHHIIRAVAAMRASGLNVQLWIVGKPGPEGASERHLHQLVQDLNLGNAVHFVGGVPQEALAEYMSAADVFCLASSREGWPNVVHEALACGCPVVASDIGGVPDMLPGRNYGMVVPVTPDFPQQLEAALCEAVQSPWDRSAIAVWGHARTWTKVAAEAVAQLEMAAHESSLGKVSYPCES
jgi:teichuronic acid biosynthesis glycosyltransferase TuaC